MTTERNQTEQLAHIAQSAQVAQHDELSRSGNCAVSDLEQCPFCGCAMRIETSAAWHLLTGEHSDRCVFDAGGPFDFVSQYPATEANLVYMKNAWNRRHVACEQVASVAQPEQLAHVSTEPDEFDLSAQRYWADQAAQGKPYESQLREACERNGISHGLDDGDNTDV